jgi:hypothetical protein
MDYLLLIVILLFLILFFSFGKEGYYSDNNTSAAASAMNVLVGKLNTLQTNMNTFLNQDLSLDAQSKLNPLLNPSEDSKYTSGVVEQAHHLSDVLSNYQDDMVQLTHTMGQIKDMPVTLKEGTLPLSDAITKLTKDAKTIVNQLNQIPDS